MSLINKLEKGKYNLFKDKLNFKLPNGKGYLPHIDGHFLWKDKNNKLQNGWKKYSTNFINLVLPLEKSNIKNGCIYISNKNNIKKLGKTFSTIAKKTILHTPNIKKEDVKKFNFIPIKLNIGDVFFFNWKCAHHSTNNLSKNSRMIFYATFCKNDKNKNLRNIYYYDKQHSAGTKKNKALESN